jgi:hypothetical protein
MLWSAFSSLFYSDLADMFISVKLHIWIVYVSLV